MQCPSNTTTALSGHAYIGRCLRLHLLTPASFQRKPRLGCTLRVKGVRRRPLSRNVSIHQHCSIDLLGRNWQRHLLVCLGTFYDLHLFLVVVFTRLFVSDVIADLHLLFNQVLGLDKRTNELFSLFFLQMAHFVLMDYICNLELLFLCLQFVLLVNQFLSQDALFVVQVEEDTKVFG